MAEMFSKGIPAARAGAAANCFDAQTRLYGGNAASSGGGTCRWQSTSPSADRMLGQPAVTACFFSEGAMAERRLPTNPMNLAALWRLNRALFCLRET